MIPERNHLKLKRGFEEPLNEGTSKVARIPETEKPLYRRILDTVLPILDSLVDQNMISENSHKVIAKELIDRKITPDKIDKQCHEIVKAIIPTALPCTFEQLEQAVEVTVQQKIKDIQNKIQTFDPAKPFHLVPNSTFPCINSPTGSATKLFDIIIKFVRENHHICSNPGIKIALCTLVDKCVKVPNFLGLYIKNEKDAFTLKNHWNALTEMGLCQYNTLESELLRHIVTVSISIGSVKNSFHLVGLAKIFPQLGQKVNNLLPAETKNLFAIRYRDPASSPLTKQGCFEIAEWFSPNSMAFASTIVFPSGAERKLSPPELDILSSQCKWFGTVTSNPNFKENQNKKIVLGSEGFNLTLEQFNQFIDLLLGKPIEPSFQEWLQLCQVADYFNLENLTIVFSLLFSHKSYCRSAAPVVPGLPAYKEIYPPRFALGNAEQIIEFLTEPAIIFASCTPKMQQYWQNYRDRVLRESSISLDLLLAAVEAYDQHPDYQAPWMKITTLTCPSLELKNLKIIQKLRSLKKLTIQGGYARNLEFISRLPYCVEKLDLSNTSENLVNTQGVHPTIRVFKRILHDLANWQLVTTKFPQLQELHLISRAPNPADYFTGVDREKFPNLKVFVNGKLMFQGSALAPK